MERLKGYTTLPFHSTLRVLHLQVESAELKKGIPLNYLDEQGQYTLRHLDGHTEAASLSEATEVFLSDNSV